MQKKRLKCHVKDCLKNNGKQMIRCLKKLNMLDSKNMKGKFMIYVDFESTLVPEDNERQNPEESYMNKYQKQVA